MIQISYQIQETRDANSNVKSCQNDIVRPLKHYLNVRVLGIFVFYCTTPLYCCDCVRGIALHRLHVCLIRGVKIQYSSQTHKYNPWVVEKVHRDSYIRIFGIGKNWGNLFKRHDSFMMWMFRQSYQGTKITGDGEGREGVGSWN